MTHSTFQENGYGPDNYDQLRFHIDGAGKTEPVYILAILRGDYPYPVEHITENLQAFDGVKAVCQVNNTIDVVVKGEEKAKNAARELHENTHQYVGAVRYSGEHMMRLYVLLREAINLAVKKGEPYHFYNRDTDSFEALVKKARSETKPNE